MLTAPWWKPWREVRNLAKHKKIIFYGRSEDWIPKSLHKVQRPPSYIVDSNPHHHGTSYLGIDVRAPQALLDEDRDGIYIVITTGSYEGVVAYLEEQGFKGGDHFCCCPEYRDFHLLEDMRNYQQDVYISSSDYLDKRKTRYSRAGGGIYRYKVGPNTVERLLPGHFRQFQQVGGQIFAVEFVEMKVYVLDLDFNVLEKHPLDRPNYTGIAHDPKRDVLVLVDASNDILSVHDRKSFKLLETVPFSNKSGYDAQSPHHMNDLCINGDSVFVSYFSLSGNWRSGVYDGGVSEFHLDRMSEPHKQVVGNLWKPHSPEFLDGNLCYLDSMRGLFYTTTHVVGGEFPGFMRGLAFDGIFYYVGISESMYMSRLFSVSNNIMLNAGFFMFDLQTKASRFYPMLDNMNIHDLLVLDR